MYLLYMPLENLGETVGLNSRLSGKPNDPLIVSQRLQKKEGLNEQVNGENLYEKK